MPDVFDLTNKYREQLSRREDQARRAILTDYRGVWRGLEDKIDSTLGALLDNEDTLRQLSEQVAAEFPDLKPGGEGEISDDKISKFAGLLLKKDSWNALENRIGDDFETVADSAAKMTGEHGNELGKTAAGHAVALMQAALQKEQEKNKAANAQLSPEEFEEMDQRVRDHVEQAWQANSATLQEAFRKKASEIAEKAREALRREALIGLLTGARGAQILGRVKQAIEDREKDPEADPALVRALRSEYRINVQDGYRESLRFTFSESGRVAGWRWTSARTAKTCAVCWAMDGKIFPLDTPLKSHPHCRCVPVPVIEDAAPPARKNGSTGEAAFAQISAEQQQAILGAKAFEAYQQGEFDLSDLVGVQFSDRFGVALYRRSVDDVLGKASGRSLFDRNSNKEQADPFSNRQNPEIDPAMFIAASFSPYSRELPWLQPAEREGSDVLGNYLNLAGPGGISLGPGDKKKRGPKFRIYRGGGLVSTVQKGQTQLQFFKDLLTVHGRAAGLRGSDLRDFVEQWTGHLNPDTFEMVYTGTDKEITSGFKPGVKFAYQLTPDILKDLQERQLAAYQSGRWRNEKLTRESDQSDSGGSGNKKEKGAKTDSSNPRPADPNAPQLPGQKEADEIITSLPGFGLGDGSFTIAVENSGGPPLSDYYILGDFIQLKFGGVMWGDKVNEYAAMALQAGVKMEVLERNDESNPRIYKVRFSNADLQKLIRLKLEWQQEYMNLQLALDQSRQEVNDMFLDFLKLYPNLGVEFLEQIANIPIDVLNELGDPVGLIPLLGPAYKSSKMWMALLGYESPDFKLFEVPRISFDAFKFKYKSAKFKREGEAIEQGSLFIINLILLKRSLMKLPKGPPENPLGLRPTPKPPSGAPVIPETGEPVIPKAAEPVKPVVEEPVIPKPEPAVKPLNEKATIPDVDTPGVPKTKTPATPKSARPALPKDEGYTGKWPPEPPAGTKPGINTTEGADWRYQRYVNDAYKNGKKPSEILSRERWESSKLRPAQTGGRPGRSGGTDQVATRQQLVEKEGFTNTETTQLGSRFDKSKGRFVRNMVDGVKRNLKGGYDYAEVDTMTQGGLPRSGMRLKLGSELKNLKPNDTLTFIDKTNPARRIEYKYGEPPSVIDTRTAPSK